MQESLGLPTNFRPDVAGALQAKETGKMMEPKQRLSFIITVYEHFSTYTLYVWIKFNVLLCSDYVTVKCGGESEIDVELEEDGSLALTSLKALC